MYLIYYYIYILKLDVLKRVGEMWPRHINPKLVNKAQEDLTSKTLPYLLVGFQLIELWLESVVKRYNNNNL